MKKRSAVKQLSVFVLLLFVMSMFLPLETMLAKAAPKLSKTELTFESKDAKAQTVKLKGIKAKKIKKVTITNEYEDIVSVTAKNKVTFSVKPVKAGETGAIQIHVEYKKPVKGSKEGDFYINRVTVKGSDEPGPVGPDLPAEVAITTPQELMAMQSYTKNKTTYYLANDIDLTGMGLLQNQYGDQYYKEFVLDGRGHTIKCDAPVFRDNCGTIKNVVFDMNMNCRVSKGGDIVTIWSDYDVCSNGGIAPVIRNDLGAELIHCKAIGTIHIDYDADITWMPVGGTEPSPSSECIIGGLVGTNSYNGKISQCTSDVDITLDVSTTLSPFVYIGGIAGVNDAYRDVNLNGQISECLYSGSLQGKCDSFAYCGGICGKSIGQITDCLNTGTVQSEYVTTPGTGIVATGSHNTRITNVLNTGNVKAGLYGNLSYNEYNPTYENDPVFENAYYLTSKSVGLYSYVSSAIEFPGVTGISDGELTQQSAFAGFDFDKIWIMTENGPSLRNVP